MKLGDGQSFLIGGGMALLAALIFAGTVVWSVSQRDQAPQSASVAARGTTVGTSSLPALPPGAPNPSLDVPRHFNTEIGGRVTSTGNDKFVIAAVSPQVALTGRQASTTPLTVLYGPNTTLYKDGAKKSTTEYQKEMQTFLHDIAYSTDTAAVYQAPDYYTHIPVQPSDITPGTFILVYSSEPVDNRILHANAIQARF